MNRNRSWPELLTMAVGLILAALAVSSCRCPKPAPLPPEPPPKILRFKTPCMEPLPELPHVTLPPVAADATSVHLGVAEYRQLAKLIIILTNYLATQLEHCRIDPEPTSPVHP